MFNIQEDENGVSFKVKVQPRSSKNKIAGLLGDALKLRITAPPVEGEANKACLEYLAKTFKVPKKQVELVSGQSSQNKLIKVYGISKDKLLKILEL
ncbi:MAG: DUF167 domain-containing protein [Clostridiales bacterium]|nr:DUF167 domain-containing protein [Clostridiales bacterium]MCF8021333.1 DUF167 domain-containing protein [Clostridiales bacterium]